MPSRLLRHRSTPASRADDGLTAAAARDIERLPVPVLVADASGRVVEWNRHAQVLLQRPPVELVGAGLADVLGRDLIWAGPAGTVNQINVHLALPAGNVLDAIAFASSAEGAQGARTTVVLAPQAATRVGPSAKVPQVQQWVEVAERIRRFDGPAVCAVVGLVGLQSVNQGYSRSTGDAVLTEIARRLQQTAGASAVVERIAGNRFAVVIPPPAEAASAAGRLLEVIREPIDTQLGEVAVGCSIGVTSGDPRSGLVLLDRADTNAERALRRGAGIIEDSDAPSGTGQLGSARLAGPLLAAVTQGVISAHFQPVVDLGTRRVVEYEALARWHQDTGHLAAANFIEAARDTGAIVELGATMLREALELAATLRRIPGGDAVRVSVNVSARELADSTFVALVESELARTTLPAHVLQLELSDHMGSDEVAQVQGPIGELRDLGVRIALDNFGGRSANLLVLRDLDVDAVKLDAALVSTAAERSSDASMLRSILSLARQLGVEVVAKGVETTAQHELLRRLGCRYGQGYLYGAPRAAADLDPLGVGDADDPDPSLPPDETGRLEKVKELVASGALDAAHVRALVDMAAIACDAGVAAFGVVEDDHEWLAAGRGVDGLELIRSDSLAASMLCADGATLVTDLHTELPGAAAVVAGARWCAGVPVRTSDGYAIGALWVVGSSESTPSREQLERLADLADHVAARVELRYLLARQQVT